MSRIIVYGADWCGDCLRAKRFLDQHSVLYEWIDIEVDPRAGTKVRELNRGRRIIPTIVFDDGSVLIEPTNSQLAAKFGIHEG
jgi:glutaredoxin-like protein